LSKASDKVYRQFMDDAEHAPAYLQHHFEDGYKGLNKPVKSQKLSLAAWRAGRDTAALHEAVPA
jgi:hypothetical protein